MSAAFREDSRVTEKTPEKSLSSRIFGPALVVILSVIWGLAFVAIRRAVLELSPINLTLLRWLVVSGSFLLLAPIIGKPKAPIRREHIPRIILVALASVGGYHLSLNYAETIVSSGLAGLLISFGPIFVVLLSAIFLKEKIGIQPDPCPCFGHHRSNHTLTQLGLEFRVHHRAASGSACGFHVQLICCGIKTSGGELRRPSNSCLGCGTGYCFHFASPIRKFLR